MTPDETTECECGAVLGELHDCPVLPRCDTPDMIPWDPPGDDDEQ